MQTNLFIDMKIRVTYDKAKTLQALRYHFLSRMEVRILLIAVNVFAIIAAGLYAFKMVRPGPFMVSSVLWFLLMLTFWFWMPRIIYSKSRTFKDTIDMTLRGDDILLETAGGYITWPYERFKYYMETPEFFHLYMNDKMFWLLPKDSVEDAGQVIADVRAKLDEKIGRRK